MPAGFTDRSTTDYRANWRTPPEALTPVCSCLGTIDLDPCASSEAPDGELIAVANWTGPGGATNAPETIPLVRPHDGLDLPWGAVRAFVNPPFNQLAKWTAKCVDAARRGAQIVLLLPARTDTRYWHSDVATAAAVCFWRGRLTFVGAKDPSKFPTAFAYWGTHPDRFRDAFRRHGHVLTLN